MTHDIPPTPSIDTAGHQRSRLAAAQWFAAARACGSNLDIRYGQQASTDGSVLWHYLPHEMFDGIGGLVHLMRQQQPRGSDIKPPRTTYSCRMILRPLWNALRWSRLTKRFIISDRDNWSATSVSAQQKNPFGQTDPTAIANADHLPLCTADRSAAWSFFSPQQTTQLKARAQQHKVSVNTWLLVHLDAAIRPWLDNPQLAVPWMIPVNMRGIEQHRFDTVNHVSSITAIVSAHSKPHCIHARIRAALQRGEHRSNSLLLRWTGFLNQRRKIQFLLQDYQGPTGSIGAFSNLGSWPTEAVAGNPPELPWLFCPPVVHGQLLGAGAVTVGGRLGLCLQAHPDIKQAEIVTASWIKRWVAGALA